MADRSKCGEARASALTAEQRSAIAKRAAQARWAKGHAAEQETDERGESATQVEIAGIAAKLLEEESKCLRFAATIGAAWDAIGEVEEGDDLAAAIRELRGMGGIPEYTIDGALAYLRERATGLTGSMRHIPQLDDWGVWLKRCLDPATVIPDASREGSFEEAMAVVRSSRPDDPTKAAIDLISAAFDFFPVCKYKGAEREAWVGRMLAAVCPKEEEVVE